MKKLSIVIPCYNEEGNLLLLHQHITEMLHKDLPDYDYEILFSDNQSKDKSRLLIQDLCKKDPHVKAIFHRINCGPDINAFSSLCQSDGDCSILIDADFQKPIEEIPKMVQQWEQGHLAVCMIKNKSKENPLVYFLRGIYYRIFCKLCTTSQQLSQFTGFGLYDRSLVQIFQQIDDVRPRLKNIVAIYAPDHQKLFYTEQKRRAGKSSFTFWKYLDLAIFSFVNYTQSGLRFFTLFGTFVLFLTSCFSVYYLVQKFLYWNQFVAGNIPILLCVLFFGGLQLLFLGILGEYIMNINTRIIHHPTFIIEKRLNFDQKKNEAS